MSRKQSTSNSSSPHILPVSRERCETAAAYYGEIWGEFGVETREDAYSRNLKVIDSMSHGGRIDGQSGDWRLFEN
jgi:hypothetical protein